MKVKCSNSLLEVHVMDFVTSELQQLRQTPNIDRIATISPTAKVSPGPIAHFISKDMPWRHPSLLKPKETKDALHVSKQAPPCSFERNLSLPMSYYNIMNAQLLSAKPSSSRALSNNVSSLLLWSSQLESLPVTSSNEQAHSIVAQQLVLQAQRFTLQMDSTHCDSVMYVRQNNKKRLSNEVAPNLDLRSIRRLRVQTQSQNHASVPT
jgi:hypothetical protein